MSAALAAGQSIILIGLRVASATGAAPARAASATTTAAGFGKRCICAQARPCRAAGCISGWSLPLACGGADQEGICRLREARLPAV